MKVPASVGYRLFLLVACQTAIAAILVAIALRATSTMADDYRHMYEFQLQSIYAIHRATEAAANLQPGGWSPALETFYHRYRTKWAVASGNTADAIRVRNHLLAVGESALTSRETELLTDLEHSIHAG